MRAVLGALAHRTTFHALDALQLRRSPRANDGLKHELFDRIRSDATLFSFLKLGSPDGLWYWNLEHPDQEWLSPRLKDVLGYRDRELPNTSAWWRGRVFAEDLDLATDHFQRLCADPAYLYDHIIRCRHKSGATVWMRCRGILVRDAAGTPIRMLGAHTRVTAMQYIEAQLGVRLHLDAGPGLVWTCEPDGRCDFVSQQWIGYTGIPAPAQLGFGWLEQVHADDRPILRDASDAAVAIGSHAAVEVRLRHHDGAFRWFDTHVIALVNAEDAFVTQLWSHTDMPAMALARGAPCPRPRNRRSTNRDRRVASSAGKVLYTSQRHPV